MHIHAMVLVFWLMYCSDRPVWGGNVQGMAVNKTLTVAYSIPWVQGWPVGIRAGSAIIVGIEEVERRQLLPGYHIDWIWRDSQCNSAIGIQMIVDMWTSVKDLDVIIGDGCSVVCQPASLLAAAWGIPIISWGCTSRSLSDKTTYPTFTRVDTTWSSYIPVYDNLADAFGWRKIVILTTTQDLFKSTATVMKNEMETHGKEVILVTFDVIERGDNIDHDSLQALQDTMAYLKVQARIFYILAYNSETRNVLIIAMDEGMLNGQYMFVAAEYHTILEVKVVYRPEVANRAILIGVMGITLTAKSIPGYHAFEKKVISAFKDDKFSEVEVSRDVKELDPYAGL